LFAATVTAEEAFALPARLDGAQAVAAACRGYRSPDLGLELSRWEWDKSWPAITTPSVIVEAWASPYLGSVPLSGPAGLLFVRRDQLSLHPGAKLTGFATDYKGCQEPIRRVCRALARELGTDRVLYLPDSGDWPSEVSDLYDTRFDDALAQLTAWGPPVSAIRALAFGRAVRNGYHYADGALRRLDGTPVPDAEIWLNRDWISSGGIARYHDGTLVPSEELARPDLRGGFAYFIDDFRDLA
jgi:hypothetical protein